MKIIHYFLLSVVLFALTGCYENNTYSGVSNRSEQKKFQKQLSQAEKGDVEAMIKVADGYYYCKGVEGDLNEAFKWYSKAADAGDAYALYMVGYFYSKAYGVKDSYYYNGDYERALPFYKKAAKLGSIEACFAGGNPEGVEVFNLAKSSKNKGKDRNYYLGMCYFYGIGTEYDMAKGLKLYQSAAQSGSGKACFELAHIYYKEQDVDKALSYAKKGAKLMGALGIYELAELQSTINSDLRNGRLKIEGYSRYDDERDTGYSLSYHNQIKHAQTPGILETILKLKKESKKIQADRFKKKLLDPDEHIYNYKLAADCGFAPAMWSISSEIGDPGRSEYSLMAYKRGYYHAECHFYGEDSIKYLKTKADNDKDAQYLLGVHFLEDKYKDYDAAFKYLSQAYENGAKEAGYYLADCYFYGKGTAKDIEKAFKLYLEAAKNGKREAQYIVGDYYWNGYGSVAKNNTTAFEWYSKSAEQHDPIGMSRAGVCYLYGYGTEKDQSKAFSLFKDAYSRHEFDESPYYLGVCYEEGLGTEVNLEEAKKHFSHIAWNDPRCALRVAYCYKIGLGTPIYLDSAKQYFERVPKNLIAKLEVANIYQDRSYRDYSFYRAFNMFKEMENTSSYAKYRLGEFYQSGLEDDYLHKVYAEKNLTKAAEYYKKAFEMASANESAWDADVSDYCCLALCYENGHGTDKDLKKALKYYKLADKFGDSRKKVEELEKKNIGKEENIDLKANTDRKDNIDSKESIEKKEKIDRKDDEGGSVFWPTL